MSYDDFKKITGMMVLKPKTLTVIYYSETWFIFKLQPLIYLTEIITNEHHYLDFIK